jgi:tetratricopeptide (TPR) repeat protein
MRTKFIIFLIFIITLATPIFAFTSSKSRASRTNRPARPTRPNRPSLDSSRDKGKTTPKARGRAKDREEEQEPRSKTSTKKRRDDSKKPSAPKARLQLTEEEEQTDAMILREAVMEFVWNNQDREAGEGLLYLAHHYKELEQYERAREYLRNIITAEPVNFSVKWEAMLLDAEICKVTKDYESSLKIIEKLINQDPARVYLIRAKIAKAELWGRNLTSIEDVYDAFYKYYKPYPEQQEVENIEYLLGFSKGYDLEIAMRAIETWEEIEEYPEVEIANRAKLQLALLYGFDLNKPEKSLELLEKIEEHGASWVEAVFLRGVLNHFYVKNNEEAFALDQENGVLNDYRFFIKNTESLKGFRVATLLKSQLLSRKAGHHQRAIHNLETLGEILPQFVASESVSIDKRRAANDEQVDWAVLAYKMAGHMSEYELFNLDQALLFYKKAEETLKDRHSKKEDPVLAAAIKRTLPAEDPGTHLFNKAFEKYRSRSYREALELYKEFVALFPQNTMVREAKFRIAVITDDELKRYDEALGLYQNYIIEYAPVKSSWSLDSLYDWSRIDEVRYRIASLLSLHLLKPVEALDIYAQLVSIYPDSYWARQGMIDSINLYQESLKNPVLAQQLMNEFIQRYPETEKAKEYRLTLFNVHLGKNEGVKALGMLRSYLDHSYPSDKDYFATKQKWRDLAFKIREEGLRKDLDKLGALDKIYSYNNLISVVGLASSSEPLESLIEEIKAADIDDKERWKLVYEANTHLYRLYPSKVQKNLEELANNASGEAKLNCLLTLGNIAYRVEKSIPNAIKWYEAAQELMGLTEPKNEIPAYRLGRLYLANGEGIKGLEKLRLFTVRYPQSRYLGRAYNAMGDACVALNTAEKAEGYYKRALRLDSLLNETVQIKLAELAQATTSSMWLEQRAKEREARKKQEKEDVSKEESNSIIDKAETEQLTEKELNSLTVEEVYEIFKREAANHKPELERMAFYLNNLLNRSTKDRVLLDKAGRQYVSTRYFRQKKLDSLIKEVPDILQKHNYGPWQADLLYFLAKSLDEKKQYEEANKAYFEYLSFFEKEKRALAVRMRIPEVFEKLDDKKNAYRFYERIITDTHIKEEIIVNTLIKKARLEIDDDKKEEATQTLISSLKYTSPRLPEICLRLEKLTEDSSYIKKALEFDGEEKFRFSALKRLVSNYEESTDYAQVAALLKDYTESFESMDAIIYIEKKVDELGKRGVIENYEQLIEQYPEDPRTAERMFKLAKMLEGTENTKYRSEDLFYEITLVYPNSAYFRESKIRAENTQTIKSVAELTDMLKKGTQGSEGEEMLIEKAHLLKNSLKDLNGAYENYESFVELFPNSKFIDEVYLELGDLALATAKDSKKALDYWTKGLASSKDIFRREAFTERINKVEEQNKEIDTQRGLELTNQSLEDIFIIWRVEKNYVFALGLLDNAIGKLENKADVSLLKYYKGRIYEETGNAHKAAQEYEKALRSFSNKGCRKDMLIYRLARLHSQEANAQKAFSWYNALTNRYPQSLLARSAYYWLSKYYEEKEDFNNAYLNMSLLLKFRTLHPTHRDSLTKRAKTLEARMNVNEMRRLKALSSGASDLSFFIGRVLENDLQDYDAAIEQYEEYLRENPPEKRSQETLLRIANLYEKKGDHVKTLAYLDLLLDTYRPNAANFSLILRMGDLLEDKIKSDDLLELFYDSIAAEYKNVRNVRVFALEKLKRIQEKKYAAVEKTVVKKLAKRVYSDEDKEVLEEIKEIKEKYIDDLKSPKQAERKLQDLWEEYPDSLATLDIMKALVKLNMDELMDPQKAADYYAKWLDENPGDPLYTEITLTLYDHYMETLRDGQRALRLLEDYIKDHPISLETLDIELKVAKANETLVRNFDEALRGYQRIVDTQQNTPVVHEAYYRMAFVYREGYADYTKAVENWSVLTGNTYYNNEFSDKAQFAIAYTYEAYVRDYSKARAAYNEILNRFPNSSLQNDARTAILRIEGK